MTRPAQVVIREAGPADYEWAAQLMAASEPWITVGRGLAECRTHLGPHSDATLYIAIQDDKPAGFVFMRERGFAGSPYVSSICVAPELRSRGIGTALLDFAESRYAPPAKHIFLLVSSINARARRLYERHGYRVVGEITDYIAIGVSEHVMHKRLHR